MVSYSPAPPMASAQAQKQSLHPEQDWGSRKAQLKLWKMITPVGCCVCVGEGVTRDTAPQTTTHKGEMRHKKDGVRERAAGGDGRGVRLRTMQVRRDRQGQRYGGKDKEDRDKRAGLYSVPSLPTQRPTEEAMHRPGKPLLGGAP